MTCLVAYDIESDRVRNKLSRFLEGKGKRLQESVFAVEVERHVFRRFLKELEKITQKKGKVAVFRLCSGCQKNALQITEDQEQAFYIF